MTFQATIKIHFDDADPAGIAFTGRLFEKIHRCYEEFIVALEQDPREFFLNSQIIYPIRSMEAEFLGPLLPFQQYSVDIAVNNISNSSFQLAYTIKNEEQSLALFQFSHVCCTNNPIKKTTMPDALRKNLEKFVVAK